MNKFITQYSKWTNEELINAYKQRFEYQDKAVEAMEFLLRKRKQGHLIEAIQNQEELEDIREFELEQQRYEQEIFKENISDIEYAKKVKSADGVYHSGNLIHEKNNLLIILSLFFSLLFIIAFIVGLFLPPLFNFSQTIFFLGALISTVILVLLFNQGKELFKLYETDNSDIFFEIQQKDNIKKIKFPFQYSFYAFTETIHTPYFEADHPTLLFIITNSEYGHILIKEDLSILSNYPPNWDTEENFIDSIEDIDKNTELTSYTLHFSSPKLRKLKKILDGLTEMYINK